MYYGVLSIPIFYNFCRIVIGNETQDSILIALSIFNFIIAFQISYIVCIFDFNYHLVSEDKYARRD